MQFLVLDIGSFKKQTDTKVIMKSTYRTKIFLWIELVGVFVGIPLLYYYNLIPFHKSIPLLAVFLVFTFLLLRSRNFDRKRFWINGYKQWRTILVRFTAFALVSLISVLLFTPENVFILPRERSGLWILIMLLYPLWSAFPQELIYRGWFFHRYTALIQNEKLFIILNAALFSFSHIIFNNLLALILTFGGGILFAYTYRNSKSLWVVFIEHMLYGNWIFTVGIGQYFYAPTNF